VEKRRASYDLRVVKNDDRKKPAMPTITCPQAAQGDEEGNQRRSADELREQIAQQAKELAEFAARCGSQETTFKEFEAGLVPLVFALARTVIALFLTLSEQRVRAQTPKRFDKEGGSFRLDRAQPRTLNGWFGHVRCWRSYARQIGAAKQRGFFPLDVSLGLTADKASMGLLAISVRMATKMSFAEARSVLQWFLPTPPSVEMIEHTALGFGRHTQTWFEQAPTPQRDGKDGQVAITMIDSKGVPTATKSELERRRGRRRKRRKVRSPRHRGRHARSRYPKKPRRKKGDKSKNARMATLVVIYTLRRVGKQLVGPINRWVYASFAPKKHAFEVARRELDRRGFGTESGKVVQLVTDGDEDLARYAKDYLPHALHTVDVMHVIEKIHAASTAVYREGDAAATTWFDTQRDRLYAGNAKDIVADLRQHLDATPKTGPGNKGKRERIASTIRYVEKRLDMMNYDTLIELDLEIGSGPVEGLVKSIIGKRCDHGGMRWIPERAEAILQLRCIETNGDWDRFVQMVHDTTRATGAQNGVRIRLQQRQANPLPAVKDAA